MYENELSLTPKQRLAALTMSIGGRIVDAARYAKVKPRTVKAWLSMVPAFKGTIRDRQMEMTEQALGLLSAGIEKAVLALIEVLQTTKSERTKLQAAGMLLNRHSRYTEMVVMKEQIDKLVAAQQAQYPRARRS